MKVTLKLIFTLFLLSGCSTKSTVQKPVAKSKYKKFTGKFDDRLLKVEEDWIGGSLSNPIYYTAKAERIYTLDRDIYVYPVTVRSVDKFGRVIFPDQGYELVGDMDVKHYLSLIKSVKMFAREVPLRIEADSNFLEKPAIISSVSSKKQVAQFKYVNGLWEKVD